MKRKISILALMILPLIANAQSSSFRQIVQDSIDEYFLPIVGLVILSSAITGLSRNWSLINDQHDEGKRKEGLQQAGMIALYTFLVIAIIGVVAGLAFGIKINVGG